VPCRPTEARIVPHARLERDSCAPVRPWGGRGRHCCEGDKAMSMPATRQSVTLEFEINRRYLVEDYAARTADAAVARERLVQTYRVRTLAILGSATGGLGLIGLHMGALSPAASDLLLAIGTASAIWLLTGGLTCRDQLERAESLVALALAARRASFRLRNGGARGGTAGFQARAPSRGSRASPCPWRRNGVGARGRR
jgi:hypothetical protein